MDDLISRKAAIEFAKDQKVKETGAYSKGQNDALNVMKSALNNPDAIPSVPAVPLDKLCEWLAGNAWHLDCSDCDGEHCDCPQLYDDSGSSPAFWKAKLTKWMEEQNASPQ